MKDIKSSTAEIPLEISMLENEEMLISNDIFSFLKNKKNINYNSNCFLYHGVRFDDSFNKLEGIFKEKKILASKYVKNSYNYYDNVNRGEYVSLIAFKDNGIEYNLFIGTNISLLVSPLIGARLTKYVPYHIWEKTKYIETKNLYSYMKGEYLVKDFISFEKVQAIGFPYEYYLVSNGKEYAESKLNKLKNLMNKYEISLPILDTSHYNSILVEAMEKKDEKRNII